MARLNPLHIDIPSAPTHLLHNRKSSTNGPHSPGVFDDATSTATRDGDASFFSLTRNGTHYPDSPSSDISSPMMTPLPFKMVMEQQLPVPLGVEKDDRKKMREYEFPSSVGTKTEVLPYQSYQNHPFTQLRQPRQQQQQQQQQSPTPPAVKAVTPVPLSYSAKYANFSNTCNTTTTITVTPQQQPTVVRVSPRPTHIYKDKAHKPSTTMALSMIEKEKMAYQYPSHRVSMVSPPPPPYISAFPSPSSTDHGAGVGVGTTTTTTTAQSAAIIAIAPPLQQLPDQQQHLPYDPTILTPASLAVLAKNKRHSFPVALARSASSSSVTSSSSPAIVISGNGMTMMSDISSTNGGNLANAPRVFPSKTTSSRDTKRHSVAAIPSSSSSIMTTTAIAGLSRPKMISHRGSNMPPQAIPIYSSTGSSAATAETMMTMMMKTPPTAFNPRSSLSSTRLLESLKYASSSASDDGVAEKDLSALIGPEDDHKNHLPMLSQANIHHHNMVTSSSSPRAQQGLLRIASLQRATAAASAAERNLILSTSRIGSGGGGVGGPLDRNAEFPDFWEDAKQHNMHWTMYSIGLAVVASLVWILMLPALMIWVPIFPGAVVLLLSAQYSTYRWRRRRHYKQQLKDRRPSPAALSSMRAASAALTHSRSSSAVATAPSSPQFHAFSPNHHHLYNSNHVRGASIGGLVGNTAVGSNGMGHAYKSSLSSMHTSVGSIATTTSDSFLEPHQPPSSTSSPPHHLRSQFQHQYYRYSSGMGSVTGSSAASSPPRFSEAYSDSTSTGMPSPPTSCSRQAPVSQHTPSPEYRRSWFSAFRAPTNNTTNSNNSNNTGDTKNSNSGRWGRTIQRRESASSSIASSETVSSSSTDSRADSPSAAATRAAPAMAGSPTSATGSFSSIPMTSPPLCPSNSSSDINMHKLSSGDVSVIMIPPPPAYVSRRCEDMTSDLAKAIIMGSTAASNEKEHLELNEKGGTLLGGSGLPEIAPLGDLMSEFAVDFGAIMY